MSNAKVNRGINLEEWNGVWVLAEQRGGSVLDVAYELIGEGRKLADKIGTDLSVLVLGNKIDEEAEKLSHYGVDQVIYFDHEVLENYTTDAYAKVVSEYIAEKQPEAVLIGATAIGRDLAPRIAGRVGTGLTADCTTLDVDPEDKKLLQTRPAFGGNLMATIVCPKNRPQMSTVRPGVMEKAAYQEKTGEIVKIVPELKEEDVLAKVLEIIKSEKKAVSLTDAQIIVAGGRGVAGAEGFELIQEFADALGGVVGASRAATDDGWIDPSHQIGQTGTTVRPKLYIACGISGAIQHVAGMSEADCIVAINKNENAPIFNMAHYGIVGDLFKVIPELINAVKEMK